jgi:hypothetical protein
VKRVDGFFHRPGFLTAAEVERFIADARGICRRSACAPLTKALSSTATA